MRSGYLGIDESNHGGRPEFFVAVYSHTDHDVERSECTMEKVRRSIPDIDEFLQFRDFRYIIMPGETLDLFSARGLKTMALREFMNAFRDLESVLVDGEVKPSNILELERLFRPQVLPKIQGLAAADQHYPLVHMADHLANFLFREYQKGNEQLFAGYAQLELKPSLEQYKFLMKKRVE